jgi:hypothetical protein
MVRLSLAIGQPGVINKLILASNMTGITGNTFGRINEKNLFAH